MQWFLHYWVNTFLIVYIMGNLTSNTNDEETSNNLKPKSISRIMDYIATYYILTMDFKSLRKLYDKEYCDKLVILTSDIIERYFTDLEITYLAQRIKGRSKNKSKSKNKGKSKNININNEAGVGEGEEGVGEGEEGGEEEGVGEEANKLETDKIIFFEKEDLNRFDIQNSIKKKRICLEIAKFYVKIAHIFASIVTTINPIYVYKDTEGKTVRASLYEKGKIPANTPRDIYKMNICENRINSLKHKNTLDPDDNGDIYVGPNVCTSNIGEDGKEKYLSDEPGIPELAELYNDDNYDFKTGIFTGMTEKTAIVFREDLKLFYNIFTGNPDLPTEITKFSDIKLREYQKTDMCKGESPIFKKQVKGPITNNLFKEYAWNLKKMIISANKNQQILLTIINELFVYTFDPQTKKKQIRVSPALSVSRLQKIVIETRNLIIKLYLTCEADYITGINIYNAIVSQKMLETNQNQEYTFTQMTNNLFNNGTTL